MTDTVTAKLAQWAALVEGATEGPWDTDGGGTSIGHGDKWVAHVVDQQEPNEPVQARADAEFIAAARTAMPALLGFVREVQKLHHLIKDSSLTGLDVDPFWRCSCGALDCPTEQAVRKWIGGEE